MCSTRVASSVPDISDFENTLIIRVAVVTAGILLVPFVVMQLTDQMSWDGADFVIMGILLFGGGLAIEFALGSLRKPTHRAIAGLIIAALFLLVWAELAVGVFGTPWAGS
ncbi:MAG: hypothetical protein ACR2J1_04770 [Methyloceanibacter sp.]|uniref:hypothetical protein n=1 Tax=Methyloceanibacter sp. TaxID=1965321 RepID=UPI003D9B0101